MTCTRTLAVTTVCLLAATLAASEATLAGRLAQLVKAGQPTGGPPSIDRIFKFMDRDQDGKLTEEEFRGPANVFNSAGKNKDGVVTRAEMEAMRSNAGKPGG